MRARERGLVAASLVVLGIAGCGDEPGSSKNVGPAAGAGTASVAGSGGAGVVGAAGSVAQGGMVATGGQQAQAGAGMGNGSSGASSGSGGSASVAGGAGTAGGSSCPISSAVAAWPGKNEVKTLDQEAQFKSDLSGLTFEPGATGVLWAVNNLSSTLFRLVPSGAGFVPDTANGWGSGKGLRYPTGNGAPDSEGVTFGASVADGMYVCSEHDGDNASTSRLSVLRYDVAGAGSTLTATREWNVTALLPKAEANAGLEGITWVPDTFLTAKGFLDDAKKAYAPADYPEHGSGLFFVGVEETGKIYALALNHGDGSSKLVAAISTPNDGVMGLEFDRDNGNLWFNCDNGCDNQSGILDIDTRPASTTLGRFVVRRQFQRPSSLPDSNNEGIAIAPNSECSGGFKRFFWTDDADEDGFSLRSDLVPCAACP